MQERGRGDRKGQDVDGVLTQYAQVGFRAIDAFTRCRVIARYGTGVDIVDVTAATRRGIQVTNAPNEWCADEVADHAVALWLAAARKICQYDRATRQGTWQWQSGEPIWRLRGQVFGLLSFGSMAQLIAERAKAFGVEVWEPGPVPRRVVGLVGEESAERRVLARGVVALPRLQAGSRCRPYRKGQ
ncbi:NAD(P)-dependent oxidoreductase [Nonomuraea sp. NPDC051941]|uniref:NAD(P)-dependent oxidoreductase n=1 Tax=Nonomuraea sp. NPDC051941 TaxID=3364373 RepID=UPI0037CAE6DD